jgi:hypothetical protein
MLLLLLLRYLLPVSARMALQPRQLVSPTPAQCAHLAP